MSRVCHEVGTLLPAYVDRSLPRLRRRLVGLHLRRCPACRSQLGRQRAVFDGLVALAPDAGTPPDGLLGALLEQAARPGVKGRAAVPARGALSGARPALSVALLVVGAAAGTGVGVGAWRGARHLQRHRRGY